MTQPLANSEVDGRPRQRAPDLLRGLVMVLMALDHARDFFSPTLTPQGWGDPADLPDVAPTLFFTRWVTHFCAPVFVFLAGAGAWLYGSRGRSRGEVARFLLTRGLWLVALEWTVMQFGWLFSFQPFLVCQVIWAIGVSMVVLAALVRLPVSVVLVLGLLLVGGHNAFDGTALEERTRAGPVLWNTWEGLWAVLHVQSVVVLGNNFVAITAYQVLPWIGVMALGWCCGPLLLRPAAERRRWLLSLGAAATAAFLAVRCANAYGNSRFWTPGDSAVDTLVAFLNCGKYPPSLAFLLMTLGPALMFLGVADGLRGRLVSALVTIGRVPLFFYVLHIYLLNFAASLWGTARFGPEAFFWGPLSAPPEEYVLGLWVAYAAWLAAVLALYPACRWFAGVKRRSASPWLSYF